jgi:hypothetical protein
MPLTCARHLVGVTGSRYGAPRPGSGTSGAWGGCAGCVGSGAVVAVGGTVAVAAGCVGCGSPVAVGCGPPVAVAVAAGAVAVGCPAGVAVGSGLGCGVTCAGGVGLGHPGTAPPGAEGLVPGVAVGLVPMGVGVWPAPPSEEKARLTSMWDLRPTPAMQATSSSARTTSPGPTRRRPSLSRTRVLAGDSAAARGANGTVGAYVPAAGDGSVQVEARAVRAVESSRLSVTRPAQTVPGLLAATTVVFAPTDAERSAWAKSATER